MFLPAAWILFASTMYPASPVMINGHPVHPTRLLARLVDTEATSMASTVFEPESLQTVRTSNLVPGLVVLDEMATMAVAGGTGPDTSKSEFQAARLMKRIAALRRSGRFEYVEPDYILSAYATPTDDFFEDGSLWALQNPGGPDAQSGIDLNTVNAWEITTGSSDVIVAVVDSGIRYTHVDLASQMWVNPREIAGNGIDDDQNGYIDDIHGINAINDSGDPMDISGHGTHVSGTIGAAANDGNPMVGIAWNVRLMACKFLGEGGGGATSDAIKCIEYAVAHGAQVVNCSWGDFPYSEALFETLVAAGEQEVLFVAGAANGQLDNDIYPNYPSGYDVDNLVAVAAIDPMGNRAHFSNYGHQSVDLGAPGVSIVSTYSTTDTAYEENFGTSMSTAHVSGVAALVAARYPGISARDLRDRLLNTTVTLPSLMGITATGGRVDAFGALSATPTNQLSVQVSPATGQEVIADRETILSVRVTDLMGVTGAFVTGTVSGGENFVFLDDGLGPDEIANDARYTTALILPSSSDEMDLTVEATAAGKTAAMTRVTYPIRHPPENDDFANRKEIIGSYAVEHGSTDYATREPRESDHAEVVGGTSAWWAWTAPADGRVTISTRGSYFDTTLAVYTGETLSTLEEVAPINSSNDFFNYHSTVTFEASAGTTYQIAVDGHDGETGEVALLVSTVIPPNDSFSDRIAISGDWESFVGTNVNATIELEEPDFGDFTTTTSVWWSWTSPADGVATISTLGSDFDTVLTVYTGAGITELIEVAGNDDIVWGHPQSGVTFDAVSGGIYQIRVDGLNGDTGTINLTVAATPLANDDFEDRIELTGLSATASGTSFGATTQPNEPEHGHNSGGASLWWTWTAPINSSVTITTIGSTYDTTLGIYAGDEISNLITIASNDEIHGGQAPASKVIFDASAGTSYHIAIDGFHGAVGYYELVLTTVHPANDDFAARTTIQGTAATISATNVHGTKEPGEPDHAGIAGDSSLWWSWTAPADLITSISTEGTDFDTMLAVYTGESISELREVTSADDGVIWTWQGRVGFQAAAGTTYQIAVDGWDEDVGTIQLELKTVPAFEAPKIQVQPESQAAYSGENVAFSVNPLGTPPFNIQWLKNGAAIAGATSTELFLPDVGVSDTGTYSAVIQNAYGAVTSRVAKLALAPATRLVNFSARCHSGDQDQTIILGDSPSAV
jgi:subtilisin family serine protease